MKILSFTSITEALSHRCRCTPVCASKLSLQHISTIRSMIARRGEKRSFLIGLLSQQEKVKKSRTHLSYDISGVAVCRSMFLKGLGISAKLLKECRNFISGDVSMPRPPPRPSALVEVRTTKRG